MNYARFIPNPTGTFRSRSGDSITIEEGPINLDGTPDGDLIDFAAVASSQPRDVAKLMFPGKKKAFTTVRKLGQYAEWKLAARGFRSLGDITKATWYEDRLEGIYKGLPEYARW